MRARARRVGAAAAFCAGRLVVGVGTYALLAVGLAVGVLSVVVGGYALAFVSFVAAVVAVGALLWRRLRRWLQARREAVTALAAVSVHLPARAVAAWLLGLRGLARRERTAVAAYRGTDVAVAYRPLPDGPGPRLRTLVADPTTWRDVASLVIVPLVVAAGTVALLALAAAAVAAIVYPPLPPSVVDPLQVSPWMVSAAWPWYAWALVAGAVLVLATVPLLLVGLAGGTSRLGAALLATGERARMRAELDEQRLRRRLAVEAAEVERRRIERDLHDGAQQRLVSLGMHLGLARRTLATNPAAGAALVAEAHEEAKLALEELRDLARGIHPAILADRGLDAALSALARRCAVPVHITVALAARPPTAVESAAYFVVAETLTNVTRHAAATAATVTIAEADGAVVVVIGDDGVGGADPSRGTGLAGLRDRLAGLGGRLDVDSPDGGPTTVRAVIPCAS